MSSRRAFLLLGLAVVVLQLGVMATAFRQDPHEGGDNAGYVALAAALANGEGYVEVWDPDRPKHTKYPPLFPAMLAMLVALGAETWTALKLLPALSTTAAVVLAYVWASGRRSPVFGAVVAALLAFSPGIRWYSQWVLSDMPFLALTLAAFIGYERWVRPARTAADGRDLEGAPPGSAVDASGDGGREPGAAVRSSSGWLAFAIVATALAYLTRSAGLPLIVAAAAWLVIGRRFRAFGAFALVVGLPALVWSLRSRAPGQGSYVSEFWLVDPYDPALGSIDPGGMVERVAVNVGRYVTEHLALGFAEGGGRYAVALVVALLGLALWGWVRAWRRGPHVVELFLPLYTGLILVWPAVWGGDRFAIPLFPLLLVYAGDALVHVAQRARRVSPALPTLAVGACAAAFVTPAVRSWARDVPMIGECTTFLRTSGAGPYGCRGPQWQEFLDAALWSGANLPSGVTVLTRKPRIFYVMSGVTSRTYAFTDEPADFLAAARDAGSRYVLLDAVSTQGVTYVGGVVLRRPAAFCEVERFDRGSLGTRLFGLVDPSLGLGGGIVEGADGPRLSIPECPSEMTVGSGTPLARPGLEIPILAGVRR